MFLLHLLESGENAHELGVVWRTETSDRVPSWHSTETIAAQAAVTIPATTLLVSYGKAIEDLGMSIESRVDKCDGTFFSLGTLLVDAVEDGRNQRRTHGSTSFSCLRASQGQHTVVTPGRKIGITTTTSVVDARVIGNLIVGDVVALVSGVVVSQVVGDNGQSLTI